VRAGSISLGCFDASVQGWINHVRQADSEWLRRHLPAPFELPAGAAPNMCGGGNRD